MKGRLAEFRKRGYARSSVKAIQRGKADPRWDPQLPAGGLVVRVRAKVLGGYEPTTNKHQRIFQTALSRDNLWLTGREHRALVKGEIPAALQKRIARYHLVDNTRGEPPMWNEREIRELSMTLKGGKLAGSVKLVSADGKRKYDAELKGNITVKSGQVVGFDVVAYGQFQGEGRFTRRAPKGKFPLAVAFELADGKDIADKVPPQGARGWLRGYLR